MKTSISILAIATMNYGCATEQSTTSEIVVAGPSATLEGGFKVEVRHLQPGLE
jgi:hypothetical protein